MCAQREEKSHLNCVEIQITGQLTEGQKHVLVNKFINRPFKVIYGDDYWPTTDDDELQEVVCTSL